MDLSGQPCLSICPSQSAVCPACMAKTLMLDMMHTFFYPNFYPNSDFFRTSMLTGIIDFFHIISLSLALTLLEAHEINRNQDLVLLG